MNRRQALNTSYRPYRLIVLGIAGDVAGLPIVESLVLDRDPQVVRAAERAVARLQAIRRAT